MAEVCRRALVEGKVQGVWFRGATREQARKLGVTGWANNLPDGRVEVVMCGSAQAVARLQQWLYEGPPLARVTGVEVTDDEWQDFSGFTIG